MAAKHTFTILAEAAIVKDDKTEIAQLSSKVLQAFEKADGNLASACERLAEIMEIQPPSLGTMRKITEILRIRDEVNKRWPNRRGENAAPGRRTVAKLAMSHGVSAEKIRKYALRYRVSNEVAAERVATLERGRRDA